MSREVNEELLSEIASTSPVFKTDAIKRMDVLAEINKSEKDQARIRDILKKRGFLETTDYETLPLQERQARLKELLLLQASPTDIEKAKELISEASKTLICSYNYFHKANNKHLGQTLQYTPSCRSIKNDTLTLWTWKKNIRQIICMKGLKGHQLTVDENSIEIFQSDNS